MASLGHNNLKAAGLFEYVSGLGGGGGGDNELM